VAVTFIVTDVGDKDATGAFVIVTLSPGLSISDPTWQALGNNQYRHNIGSLKVGVSDSFTVDVTASVDLSNNDTVSIGGSLGDDGVQGAETPSASTSTTTSFPIQPPDGRRWG
jgi:hypothetical protein